MTEFIVTSPPDGVVSAMEFSPSVRPLNLLVAGSWDKSVRCWEVEDTGATIPKLMMNMSGPVLDVCWSGDCSQVFVATGDNQVNLWDLASNQVCQVAAHDGAVKTCHVIEVNGSSCLMTGSWDKTVKFWDTRTSHPIATINLTDRCHCADTADSLAVVGSVDGAILTFSMQHGCMEYHKIETPLECLPSAIKLFTNHQQQPIGYVLGGTEGRVTIQYLDAVDLKHLNFTFRCHQSVKDMEVYPVNDIAIHPVFDTIATVSSDGTFGFWDKEERTNLLIREPLGISLTKCCFDSSGFVFAYAVGQEHFDPAKKPQIILRACLKEVNPSESCSYMTWE